MLSVFSQQSSDLADGLTVRSSVYDRPRKTYNDQPSSGTAQTPTTQSGRSVHVGVSSGNENKIQQKLT